MRGVEHMPRLYDLAMRVVEPFGLGRWRSRLTSDVHGRVLEIGCGTGRNLPRYPADAKVVAFDPDLELVHAARSRAPGVRLLVALAEALPFRDRSFDLAVSSLVLCSVSDQPHAVDELARVAPTLRALEHVRARSPLLARIQDVVQPAWTWFTGGCHPNRDTERAIARRFAIEERDARGATRFLKCVSDPQRSDASAALHRDTLTSFD